LGTSDKFLKDLPMTVKRMLRALLRTTREMRERPADFGEFVAKALKMDRDLSIAAAESGSRTISVDGLLSDEAYKNLIGAGSESGAVKGTPIAITRLILLCYEKFCASLGCAKGTGLT
jgi:ABC-type nitrate/sulfonate/bicarbonate transport system substrate-binding protein